MIPDTVRMESDGKRRFSSPEKLIPNRTDAIITPMVTQTDFRVRYSETDGQRRAHHSHYPVWFEMGRADFCRQAGFDYKRLEDTGFYLVIARLECQYKAPLEYDDLVRIETRLVSLSRKLMTFEYQVVNMSRNDTPAGEGTTVLVCVDRQGRPTSLPPDVNDRLLACTTPAGGKIHASLPGG
ncbi:MAG: thioesterase family protein [Nitrospiraceae bacterium]|nr:thioesterase family protein [Nitrospiraceae bacterium]